VKSRVNVVISGILPKLYVLDYDMEYVVVSYILTFNISRAGQSPACIDHIMIII
jgi:hypothetical protein